MPDPGGGMNGIEAEVKSVVMRPGAGHPVEHVTWTSLEMLSADGCNHRRSEDTI